MAEDLDKIQELSNRLDQLLSMHNSVSTEIDSLRVEIIRLKVKQKSSSASSRMDENPTDPIVITEPDIELINEAPSEVANDSEIEIPIELPSTNYFNIKEKRTIDQTSETNPIKKFDLEKLIGENLISKIGMVVLLIGVAVLAKYSIENDLISPLGRIVLGYIIGVVLLGLGMYLKKKYLSFSAVLVSGAMAIFYFITFFAFNFYQLIGQEVAFGLMVIFTIFTVLAALKYDQEIIAHLGLVGAVSVPFLLSNDSGNATFLFSYLALINLGIAFISLKKNWKLLFYSSFVLTWIVFGSWLVLGYKEAEHFTLAFCFLTLFFILFYVIFIAYKFLNLKKYNVGDVIVLLLNSLIFFGIGYGLLYDHKIGSQLLGVFAIGNAVIHFIAAYIINTRKLADRNLFYLIIGLVLVCLTLAIPIQLDGHWVTIMWSAEAVVLFLIGRSKKVAFYEYLSFALMAIAVMSLLQDWETGYTTIAMIDIYRSDATPTKLNFLINPLFLTSFISILCFGIISWIHNKKEWKVNSKVDDLILKILDYAIPVALILLTYFALRREMMNYFSQLYAASMIDPQPENESFYSKIYNATIPHKASVWLLNYSLLFFSILSILVLKRVKEITANKIIIGINLLIILGFLTLGLYALSELRENYLTQYQAEYYTIDNSFIWLRYLSIACLAFLIGCTYFLLKKINKDYKVYMVAEILFYLVVFWVLSSELIHWLDFTERSETYGLALSIFWGIFSVVIIALGIWKKKKHLRILGIAIFAITLIKLFFYDLSNLNTISKTIVMISLGALLLLTSFLYNKYTIEDEEKF